MLGARPVRSTCSTPAPCAGPCSSGARCDRARGDRARDVKFSRNQDKGFAPQRTSCGRPAPTRCWPRRAKPARAGSSPRASPSTAGTPPRAARSRPRTIRSSEAPAANTERSAAALDHLERAVTEFGGIALRYGVFYGAANDGADQARCAGASSRSSATAAASGHRSTSTMPPRRPHLRSSTRGRAVYNIVDDDPAAVREWLPVLAERPGREAAAALPGLVRAAARRRGRGRALHRGSGRLEREGPARARLDAAPSQLARRASRRSTRR